MLLKKNPPRKSCSFELKINLIAAAMDKWLKRKKVMEEFQFLVLIFQLGYLLKEIKRRREGFLNLDDREFYLSQRRRRRRKRVEGKAASVILGCNCRLENEATSS